MFWMIILGLVMCALVTGLFLYGWIFEKKWALVTAAILILVSGVIVGVLY